MRFVGFGVGLALAVLVTTGARADNQSECSVLAMALDRAAGGVQDFTLSLQNNVITPQLVKSLPDDIQASLLALEPERSKAESANAAYALKLRAAEDTAKKCAGM